MRVVEDLARRRVRLVGRDSEVRVAQDLLTRGVAGEPAVVIVKGEAGIGKSRLVAAAMAAAAPLQRLIGHCAPSVAGETPFAPVVEAVREGLRGVPAAGLSLDGGRWRVLAPLFPEFADGEAVTASGAGSWERTRLMDALVDVLFRLAESTPAVLVIEDAHWADRDTAHVLTVLARRLEHQRLAVLLTARDDEQAWSAGQDWLVELRRLPSVAEVSLHRLPRDQVEVMLGELVDEPVPASVADWVQRVSEGNPYAVVELARAVRAGRAGVPATLTGSALARLRGVSPAAQLLAELLAAARQPLSEETLTAASGLDQDAAAALRELLDRHAVVVAGPDRFLLRHALLAEAVTGEMLPSQRRRRHEQLAEALSCLVPAAPAAEVSGHWIGAQRWPEALRWTVRAVDAAAGVFGYAAAAAHAERAIRLWDHVADAQAITGTTRWRLLRQAIEYWQFTGRYAESRRLAVEFADAVRREHPVEAAVLLAHYAEALLTKGRDTAASVAVVREAVELSREAPIDVRLDAAMNASWVLFNAGFPSDAARIATEATSTGAGVTAPLLTARGCGRICTGDVEGGIADLERALALAGNPFEVGRAGVGLTDALWRLNRLAEAVEIGRPMLAPLRAAGLVGRGAQALRWNVALSLLELGRLDEADDVLADGVSRPLDDSNKYDYGLHARLLRLRGRIDDAARIGASVSDLFGRNAPEIDIPLTVEEAELALARGEPELVTPLVTSAYERSAGSSEEWQLAQLAWLGARAGADLAVRSRGSGRPDRAAQAVAAIERLVAGLPAAAQQPGPEGLGVVVRGFGAALAAENARAGGFDATDLWRQALTVWRELDRPVYALYCGFRLAEALAESGAVTEAQTVLEATDQEAATIGLRPLSDELAVLARRYRLRVGCYPASDGPLTARETEILALIAAGRSNQQIGSELYLSPSTVRVHVSNILRKLQAATRAEAAAIAYQRGLLP